jgi:hypothetical protein
MNKKIDVNFFWGHNSLHNIYKSAVNHTPLSSSKLCYPPVLWWARSSLPNCCIECVSVTNSVIQLWIGAMEYHSGPQALSNWRHGTRTAQWGTDTEKDGLKQSWAGFELKLAFWKHLGIVSKHSPLLRMFRWLCHSLCLPEKDQTQEDFREDARQPKMKNRTCCQCPEGKEGRLQSSLCITPLCDHYSSCRAAGPGVASSLVVEGWSSPPSGYGRGLSGQGACITISLLVDVEVSGHVELVGSMVQAHPRLPSSCWAHLFCPQISKYMESSPKYYHHYLPVQRFFGLTINL